MRCLNKHVSLRHPVAFKCVKYFNLNFRVIIKSYTAVSKQKLINVITRACYFLNNTYTFDIKVENFAHIGRHFVDHGEEGPSMAEVD